VANTRPTFPTWLEVRQALTRPYRVTASMLLLVSLVPVYLVIASYARDGEVARPATALDALFPLTPIWALIYGALYLFLIVLPVLVVQDEPTLRATVRAWLAVWLTSYAIFLFFPTVAPRPDEVGGSGFAAWGLRFLYRADPPFNCFPSLHVAHTVVSAFACRRVHVRLGDLALVCALLVALSTLFTKQHYVVDVIAGAALATLSSWWFVGRLPDDTVEDAHRRVAPGLALVAAVIVAMASTVFVVLYIGGIEPEALATVPMR
jgi:membrane-associated phospholipid phosphatase